MSTNIEQYKVAKEPFYKLVGNEVELYEAAYAARMPMMLKGPTGCGKSRFVEYLAWRLEKPLITVACNEDMTASDLVGRFLLRGDETQWVDGPLTQATTVREIASLSGDVSSMVPPHVNKALIEKFSEMKEEHSSFATNSLRD